MVGTMNLELLCLVWDHDLHIWLVGDRDRQLVIPFFFGQLMIPFLATLTLNAISITIRTGVVFLTSDSIYFFGTRFDSI